MPYTGNLLRISQPPTARTLPPPSPRHGVREVDPYRPEEREVPSGTGSEYAGSDYSPVVMSGHGMPLDTPLSWRGAPPGSAAETPYQITYPGLNPHASDAVLSADGAYPPDGGRVYAHDGETDRGFLRVRFSPGPQFMEAQPRGELDTDGFASPYDASDGGGPGRGATLQRGRSSLPVNNPPRVGYPQGFRLGRDRWRFWDNDTFQSVSRVQGVQMMQPRDVYTPNGARRMVADMVTAPALSRTAGSPDSVVMAATAYPSSSTSVIGAF